MNLFFCKLLNAFLEELLRVQSVDIYLQKACTFFPYQPSTANHLVDQYLSKQLFTAVQIEDHHPDKERAFPQALMTSSAPSGQSELRWAITKSLDLYEQGVAYEDIAFVYRDLRGCSSYLYWEFSRLQIPFTVRSELLMPSFLSRRLSLFMKLLQSRERLKLKSVLILCDRFFENEITRPELELFCEQFGISTLEQLAGLRKIPIFRDLAQYDRSDNNRKLNSALNSEQISLYDWFEHSSENLDRGTKADEQRTEKPREKLNDSSIQLQLVESADLNRKNMELRFSRKQISLKTLYHIEKTAIHLLDLLKQRSSGPRHIQLQIRETDVIAEALGWSYVALSGVRNERSTLHQICQLLQGEDSQLELLWGDWLAILGQQIRGYSLSQTGGKGGGIQIFSAEDAAGQSFEHLFLLNLNRGVFPEQPASDPLLPDDVRLRLSESILPDLSMRSNKLLSELLLFCSLAGSSKHLFLSYQRHSDDGKEQSPSPFLSSIGRDLKKEYPLCSALYTALDESNLQVPLDCAQQIALYGGLSEGEVFSEQSFVKAVEEHYGSLEGCEHSVNNLARGTLEVIQEHYPPLFDERALTMGPFSGLTGSFLDMNNGENKDLVVDQGVFVTRVEDGIDCPWRLFLSRYLGLKERKIDTDLLPDIAPDALGTIVHEVLEEWVLRASKSALGGRARTLEEAYQMGAFEVPHFQAEDLDKVLQTKTELVLSKKGQIATGLHRIAAQRALEQLELFFESFNEQSIKRCLGAELDASFSINVPISVFGHGSNQASNTGSQKRIELVEDCSKEPFHHSLDSYAFKVHFKVDRVDLLELKEGVDTLAEIGDFDSTRCAVPCLKSAKSTCYCALAPQPNPLQLHFVDYKTGKPPTALVRQERRCSAWMEAFSQGKKLQALAYAASGPSCRSVFSSCLSKDEDSLSEIKADLRSIETRGTLVFLKTETMPQRAFGAYEGGLEQERWGHKQIDLLGKTTAAALLGRSLGIFFPRLVRSKRKVGQSNEDDFTTNRSCQWCSFRQACRYGDSAEKRRLVHSLELKTASSKQPDEKKTAIIDDEIQFKWAVQDMIWQIGKN